MILMRSVSFVGVVLLSSIARAQQPAAANQAPEIVSSGRGEIRVAPDRASIDVAVETRAATAAEAGRDNARRLQAVLDTLKRVGFVAPAVTTTGYAVHQDWRHESGKRRSNGYVARNGLRVRLEQLERIGVVIDAALAGGATSIGAIQYTLSNESQRQLDALSAAVTEARRRAQVMAEAAGGTLGPLRELSTERREPFAGSRGTVLALQQGFLDTEQQTQITPGELTIVATVIARWEFTPSRR